MVGAGVLSVMPSRMVLGVVVVLNGWELLGQPGRRGAAGQLSPLPGQMGLVGVATASRNLGQARPCGASEHAVDDLEPHHPTGHLRTQAEFEPETLTQVSSVPPDALGQRADLDSAMAGGQPLPGPPELRCRSIPFPMA